MKARFYLPLVFVVLSACAVVEREKAPSGGDHPQAGKALVYFYRPKRFVGSARGVQISDRKVPIGDLGSGTYFVYQATAGEHLFNGNGATEDAVPVRLEPNHTYYFRCIIEPGMWLPHYSVEQVPNQSGLPEGLKRVRWLGR